MVTKKEFVELHMGSHEIPPTKDLPHAPSFEESLAILGQDMTRPQLQVGIEVLNAQTFNRIAIALEALLTKIDSFV